MALSKTLRWYAARARTIGNPPEKAHFRFHDFTMVPREAYLANLQLCAARPLPPGCVVECGVWRGGMSAGIAEVLPGRRHFLFDSFEGLPPASEKDGDRAIAYQRDKDSPWYYDNCTAERSFADRAMQMSRAGGFELVQGWFDDTVPGFAFPEPIALLRLDGDWYDSTMTCLRALMPKVIPGGLIIIDDYYFWDGCARAIHDYLSAEQRLERIEQVKCGQHAICYFIKRADA